MTDWDTYVESPLWLKIIMLRSLDYTINDLVRMFRLDPEIIIGFIQGERFPEGFLIKSNNRGDIHGTKETCIK